MAVGEEVQERRELDAGDEDSQGDGGGGEGRAARGGAQLAPAPRRDEQAGGERGEEDKREEDGLGGAGEDGEREGEREAGEGAAGRGVEEALLKGDAPWEPGERGDETEIVDDGDEGRGEGPDEAGDGGGRPAGAPHAEHVVHAEARHEEVSDGEEHERVRHRQKVVEEGGGIEERVLQGAEDGLAAGGEALPQRDGEVAGGVDGEEAARVEEEAEVAEEEDLAAEDDAVETRGDQERQRGDERDVPAPAAAGADAHWRAGVH